MYNPLSTYRIQFNKDFTFNDFKKYLDYFAQLGIGTIYASPVFKSTPGSKHGYDVTDPNSINPEIGDLNELNEIIEALKEKNIGWLQDIVPNHMAMSLDNPWLLDVLKKGQKSKYAKFFDIDFTHPDFNGKLIFPFLGKSLDEAIETGEVKLIWKDNNVRIGYFDFFFPLNEETEKSLSQMVGENSDPTEFLKTINTDPSKLKEILNQQYYLLAPWQEASKHLNYRRFFTINGLISLKMENEETFKSHHRLISRLVAQEKIRGLRIDHIDGLKEPGKYLEKLRVLTGDETYLVVEKILEPNENLISEWPIQGSTGYDFLGIVNNVFTYQKNYPHLKKFYQEFTGINESPEEIIYQKKKLILYSAKQGDLDNLYRLFMQGNFVSENNRLSGDHIKKGIAEFLICFPRYKSYSWFFPLSAEDRTIITKVTRQVESGDPSLGGVMKVFQNIFIDQEGLSEQQKEAALNFYLRCMQYTGSLMAKGVEDTAMYYYNCFLAHNEVGDAVTASGISIKEFHEAMIRRQRTLPLAMNATSTHDTKRGEDVRARLNILSEQSHEWIHLVRHWSDSNEKFKTRINQKTIPSRNEEYFIYQTIAGIYPLEGDPDEEFLSRLRQYFMKALREAKISSNWNNPDEEYEKSVFTFLDKILEHGSEFLTSFVPFHNKIAKAGLFNSLSQLVLKSTCPGIPDFYQGTELWDFSLVDPDNRRPVNYDQRLNMIDNLIRDQKEDWQDLYDKVYLEPKSGNLKLLLTRILLKERSLHPTLFAYGKYIPLTVTGNLKDHVIAFARVYKQSWFVVVVPLYPSLLFEQQGYDSERNAIDWEDTSIEIPDLAPEKWLLIQQGTVIIPKGKILLSSILKNPFPCFLKGTKELTSRKAGVLLHLTSLPGKYGMGDLGEPAYSFADYLWKSAQAYWQILPVNPVEEGSDYSPYSTLSAMAGNLMLINPDQLVRMRLIREETLKAYNFKESNRADFKKAEQFRSLFLDEAYRNFKSHYRPYLEKKFEDFCAQQQFWLDDYVLYASLKKRFKGMPWIEWPEEYIQRDKTALQNYARENFTELDKFKFWQFLFSWQWNLFREYVNHNEIKIIGDVPFYVNYDSVEVWQYPELFKLDRKKKMTGVAGVPPDYFSEEGQLWAMPVYNWDHMKRDEFTWWRKRIARNLEFCDLIRFDHFRGFSAFWEVPPGEKTAQKGKWKPSPGYALFKRVRIDFPTLPFIAEDLGDIDEEVYKLRDAFHFPGLEVLQFAFDRDMQKSVHIPFNHKKNSLVYTGTHDNNTTRGWFKNELSKENKLRINDYLDKVIKINTAHLDFIRMCYNSVALTAIVPMQDILGLDADSRINNPALKKGNWTWKLKTSDLRSEEITLIRSLVKLYGRI